jgi:16S rRNA (adenine(1408)-N(1))-methyltransferase
VIVDLGTGDGRAVLSAAAADPRALVIGIDADAAAMAQSSRRAARPTRKGGLPNALFVVAAAEAVPRELHGRADVVTVRFPWGSLLRGVLGLDRTVGLGIAALVRPDGGRVDALVSVTERDRIDGFDALDAAALERIAAAHRAIGLELVSAADASIPEIRAAGSTWGKRLVAGRADRPVVRLSLRRLERPRAPSRARPSP